MMKLIISVLLLAATIATFVCGMRKVKDGMEEFKVNKNVSYPSFRLVCWCLYNPFV